MTRPRAGRLVAMALAVSLTVLVPTAPAWSATSLRVGDATVVRPDQSDKLLRAAGSATAFTLRLPARASCPGDSTNDNYRIQSFLIPDGSDPATIRYRSVQLLDPGEWALYDTFTNPFVNGLTDDRAKPGGPGLITEIPAFSMGVFDSGQLHAGPYHMGIACTLLNKTVKYWSVDVTITLDSHDEPAHLRWSLVGADAPGADRGVGWAVPAGIAGVVIVAGVALVRRRGRADAMAGRR